MKSLPVRSGRAAPANSNCVSAPSPCRTIGCSSAGGDAEINRIPGSVVADGGVELELDGEFARPVEDEHQAVLIGAHAPAGLPFEIGERDAARKQGQRSAMGILHARGRGEGKRGGLIIELASELEIPQHHAPCFRVGGGYPERQGVGRALEPECERHRLVGLGFAAHRLGEELEFDGDQAGDVARLHVEVGRGFDFDVAAEERGLRGSQGERRERVRPVLELALRDDGDGQLGDRFVGFAGPKDQGAHTVGFEADAPVRQGRTGDLADFAFARDRERQFLRLPRENVEGGGNGIGKLVAGDLDGVLEDGGEDGFLLVAGPALEDGLDDQPGLAVFEAAVEGEVLDLRGGAGGTGGCEPGPEQQGDQQERNHAGVPGAGIEGSNGSFHFEVGS